MANVRSEEFPKFSELPLHPSHPAHSAWGIFGKDDELGTLNHLTPERTVEAAKLITTGTRVGLNWAMEQMDYAGEGFRQVLEHKIYELGRNMNVRLTLDIREELWMKIVLSVR